MSPIRFYVYHPITRNWKGVNNVLAVVIAQKVQGYTLVAEAK